MKLKTTLLFLVLGLVQKLAWAAIGITKDDTENGYSHWSAAHAFTQDEATVHAALPSLARQAYEEMIADAERQGIPDEEIPATVAALGIGSDVYFSFSLRGRMFLLRPGRPHRVHPRTADELAAAIVRCQQEYGTEHSYKLRCAEPLAIQQWLVNNQQIPITGQGKVSTYGMLKPDQRDNLGILNPCSMKPQRGTWGCQIFLSDLQISRVGNQGDMPELPTIEPAQALPHCFWTNPA